VDVIAIDELLRGEGITDPVSRAQARAILERHGLTSPRKANMAAEKILAARALLAERTLLLCDDPGCAELAAPRAAGREQIIVEPPSCAICAGSGQRRAALLLARDLLATRRPRLLLVGGTPQQHHVLAQALAEGGTELRAIEGLGRGHSAAEAARQAAWADVVAIWAATPIKHKVSQVYTDAPAPHAIRVMVARRGVESLCAHIRAALAGGLGDARRGPDPLRKIPFNRSE
jgi:hypothetical protein